MAKKKTPGRARERGETVAFTVDLPAGLDEALEACADAEDRTKRATVIRALKAYLAQQGFWVASSESTS